MNSWDGQSPPTARTYLGKPVVSVKDIIGKTLPNFGPFAKQKKELVAAKKANSDVLGDNSLRVVNRPPFAPNRKIPAVQEVIGRALNAIGTYNDLDNRYKIMYFITTPCSRTCSGNTSSL